MNEFIKFMLTISPVLLPIIIGSAFAHFTAKTPKRGELENNLIDQLQETIKELRDENKSIKTRKALMSQEIENIHKLYTKLIEKFNDEIKFSTELEIHILKQLPPPPPKRKLYQRDIDDNE